MADSTQAPASLIIPMSVHAVCLGTEDVKNRRFHGPSTDVSRLSGRNFRPSHISHLPQRGVDATECGVHLHWVLPWAWRRGVVQEGEGNAPVVFPSVPDRWLVTRIVEGGPLKSWIVESDYCATDGRWKGVWIPSCGDIPAVFLGRSVPLERWRDRGARWSLHTRLGQELTAVGWGDPAFAAYYPNCRNIFGFHDDMQGVKAGAKVKYIVTGWHARAEQDLIRCSLAELDEHNPHEPRDLLRSLGLRSADWISLTRFERSLLSGIAYVGAWNPRQNLSGVAPAFRVALGNTMEECLSSLIATGGHTEEKMTGAVKKEIHAVEKEINALHCAPEVFTDPLYADKTARELRMAEAEHMHRFGSIDAGTLWAVRPQGARTPEESRVPHLIEADAALAEALSRLNEAQHTYDYKHREAAALERRVQHGWQQLAELVFGARKSAQVPDHKERVEVRQNLRRRIQQDLDQRDAVRLPALKSAVVLAKAHVESCLARHPNDSYVLERVPPPRYWKPLDPVVLIDGVEMTPPVEEPAAGAEDALLFCRSSSTLPTAKGELQAESALWQRLPLNATLRALIHEASLCSHQKRYDGGDEEPRVRGVEQWRPRFILWSAKYHPAHPMAKAEREVPVSYTATTLTAAWGKPSCAAPELPLLKKTARQETVSIQNFGLANVKSVRRLHTAMRKRVETDPEKFKALEKTLKDTACNPGQMVSASLEGLHDALLMFSRGVDLKDPALGTATHFERAREVAEWSGGGLRPDLSGTAFSPLRGGWLSLESLEMVDVFGLGQAVEMKGPLTVSQGLKRPEGGPVIPGEPPAFLPPRLCMPARLVFRFKSAAHASVDSLHHQTRHSPVLGWIIPDHFDQALQLCDAEGRPLGLLRPSASMQEAAIWHEVNAMPGKDTEIHQLLAACQQPSGSALVSRMLQTFDHQLASVVAADGARDASLALLIGRPLAIVRAEIGLDLHDPLPRVQNLTPLLPHAPLAEHMGFQDLRIPVRLGDDLRQNDGLVGFFHGGSGQTRLLYSTDTFHPPTTLEMHVRPGRERTPLLLFVDPQAPVHASTGLLPEKSIRLLPAQYRYSLEKIGLLFSCGPILQTSKVPWPLPLPAIGEHAWQLGTRDASGLQWQSLEDQPSAPSADGPASPPVVRPQVWLSLIHSPQPASGSNS